MKHKRRTKSYLALALLIASVLGLAWASQIASESLAGSDAQHMTIPANDISVAAEERAFSWHIVPAGTNSASGVVSFDNLLRVSPNGRHIAYVTAHDLGMTGSAIWIANIDGSEARQLVTGGDGFWVTNPVWSPDSNEIVYLKVIETKQTQYEVDSSFELWVINLDGSHNELLSDTLRLNPSLGYGGEANILWNANGEIEFDDYSLYPAKRYALHQLTQVMRDTGVVQPLAVRGQPSNVPFFYQCYDHDHWGEDQLGTCSGKTICSHGCAITSVAMVFKYFGASIDPGLFNTWLTDNSGYSNGCDINWFTAANYDPNISCIDRIWTTDWNRLNSELDAGYPVVADVGGHFVVVTRRSGSTYYVNDPVRADGYDRTLADYGNTFSGLAIYHGPVSPPPPPSCPPENCTPGNEVGRDFFVEVVERLADVPLSDFAVDALVLWEPHENTLACWNPLATTRRMEFVCDFNSVGVQHYQSQDMGTQATADTLALGYYDNIRRMLRLEEFNREGLRADLDVWGTCSGQTCNSLLNEWEALWIAHGGDTALLKQCSDLTHDPENPQVGEEVTLEFTVCNYSEQAITLQDIGPQGFAPNGGLWNEFAHNVTVNNEDTVTVSVSRSFAWEGTWTVDKIVYRDQADGSWHDLSANGYIQSHTFQVSSTPPPPADVPTPISPANGSHFPSDTTSVIFTWSVTTGPYEVELWWDGGSQMSGWLDDPTWTATGLSPRTYYWHVRATGPTNWSEDYQFTIDSPGAPWATPVSPANDSYFQYGTTSVTLTATGSGGPYQFEIWWAGGSTLSGWLDDPTWTVDGLSPGVYYWHVMATGMANWSQDFHFTIHSPGATPISPPNGSYFQYGTTSVTLTASGSGGPYQFEIWWGGGSRISGWLDDPTWTVDGLSSGTYYWHVMATGMTDWSQDFHFTIHSPGAHPTSPPDGHQFPNGTSQVTLEAEGSGGPYKFEIWWNGGSEISGWVDDPRWTTSTHGPGDYHWHVMAWGMSNWSVDWHFTVLRPPDNDPPIGSVLINATEMPSWTVEYTADALPPFSIPPWERSSGWQGYEWAEYGILRSGTYSTDSYNYYRQAADLSNETGTTLEARLKVVSGQPLSTGAIGNNISIFDDTKKIRLAIFPDGIKLADCDACDEYEMDTTDDFHVYRLTLQGNAAKAYVDGVPRLSGTPVANSAWTEIWFGNDWMGAPDEGFWDYVRYYTGGAVPPSAEFTNSPDVTLTLSSSDVGWGLSKMNIGIYNNAAESYNYLGWEDYSGNKMITLSSGDGVKCVAVQYRDQADNLSDWYYDCIVLDTILPDSTVSPLAATQSALWFPVTWWGTDATSGIKSFDVQYKEGASGVWTDWITDTTTMSATFCGQNRRTYYFRSRGTDSAGNVEAYPGGEGDAHTCILLGDLDSSGQVNVLDIMEVASRWRTSCDNPNPDNNPDTPNYKSRYDLDHDCDIDVVDIMLVAAHWGERCE